MKDIHINKKIIGKNSKAFIIAEISANHNQKFDLAIKTIEAAKNAGADAVKLQTYTADTLTINSSKKYFQIQHGTLWDGTSLYDLYKKAYTPWNWQPKLKEYANSLGLSCFSSPFDKSAVDFLEKMDVPAYKVASFEIVDIPLIKYIATKGKPIIISTGIAKKDDIELAIKTCRKEGNNQLIILKCTSQYPTPLDEVNLLTMSDISQRFRVLVGVSDHTIENLVPLGSVVLGGKMIEKHIILDRSLGGPDADFSLEPNEFKAMVDSVRDMEKALGKVTYKLSSKKKSSRKFARSLFVVKDIKKGEIFSNTNIRSIRPSDGLHPKHYFEVLGKEAKQSLERGTPLKRSHY